MDGFRIPIGTWVEDAVDWAARHARMWRGRMDRLDAYLQRLQQTKETRHARKLRHK